jgi:hypothetical protein
MSSPYRIASGTLTNALAYPANVDTTGVARRHIRLQDALDAPNAQTVTPQLQCVGTFGTATIQPQQSLDGGTTWVAVGSAISAAGVTSLGVMAAGALFRILITGTGDITGATVHIS